MKTIEFYDVEQAAAPTAATAATAAAKSPYAALELLDAGFAAFNADYAATVAAFEQSLAELDSLTELIAAGARPTEIRDMIAGAQARLAETASLVANVAEREEQVIAVQKSIVKSLGGAETDDFAALQQGFAAALADKLDLAPNELELATTDAAKTTAAAIVSKALEGTEAAAAITAAASADAAAAEKAVVIKAVAKANEAASKAASKAAKALAKAATAEKAGDKAAAALAKAQAKAAKELVKTVEQQKKNIAKAEAKAAQEALEAAKKAAEAEKAAVAEAAKKGADELKKEAAAAKAEAQKQLAEQKAAEKAAAEAAQKAAAEAQKAAAEAEQKALDEVKAAIAAGKDADAAAEAAKPADAELENAAKDATSKAETGSAIVNPELDKALEDATAGSDTSKGGSTGGSTGGNTQVDTSFAFNYSATCEVVFKSKADYEKFVAGIEVAEQPGSDGAPAGGTVEASKEKKAAEPKTVAETAGETKPAEGAETKPAEPAKPKEPTDEQIKEALGKLAAKDWAAKGIVLVDDLEATAASAANEMKFIQKTADGIIPANTEIFTANDTITIAQIAGLEGDNFTVANMKAAGVKSIGGKAFDQGTTQTNVKLTFGDVAVEFVPLGANNALRGEAQFDKLVLLDAKAGSSLKAAIAAGAVKAGELEISTTASEGATTTSIKLSGTELAFADAATLAAAAKLASTSTLADLKAAGVSKIGAVALAADGAATVAVEGGALGVATTAQTTAADLAAIKAPAGVSFAEGAFAAAPTDATALDLSDFAATENWKFDGDAAAVTITAPALAAGKVITFELANFDDSDSLKIKGTAVSGTELSTAVSLKTGSFTVDCQGVIKLDGATASDAVALEIAGKLDDQAANSVYMLNDGKGGGYLINIGAKGDASDNIVVHLTGTVGDVTVSENCVSFAGLAATAELEPQA